MATTKFDAFLRRRGILTKDVAEGTGYHRNHISRIRNGKTEPTRECMAEILHWIRKSTGERVQIDDVFEFTRRKAS